MKIFLVIGGNFPDSDDTENAEVFLDKENAEECKLHWEGQEAYEEITIYEKEIKDGM